MNRRHLVKLALTGAGAVALTIKTKAALVCSTATKEQTEGPFYPNDWREFSVDADMTKINDNDREAIGQHVIVQGKVIDHETCLPISNAQVDIWQANTFGQYFHKNDSVFEDLKDKNFQYRCRVTTNADGEFSFKTIKPSPYPANNTWIRPPHIHFKVITKTHEELTTQMYFGGDPLNDLDLILQNMTSSEQNSVVVNFNETKQKVLEGIFEIALKRI